MKTFFMTAQAGLIGIVAGELYDFQQWQFWAICLLNAILVVMSDIADE